MRLGFVINDAGACDMVKRFDHNAQSLVGLAGTAASFREQADPVRNFKFGAGRPIRSKTRAQRSQAICALSRLHERPAANSHRLRRQKWKALLIGERQQRLRPLQGLSCFSP
jgi:hypothetical protein